MYTLSQYEDKENTLGLYKFALQNTDIHEKRGLMVHFVPQFHQVVKFEKLAAKLTRETWRALKTGSGTIQMEDGSLNLNTLNMEQKDIDDMLSSHKKKEKGPWYIRFLRTK